MSFGNLILDKDIVLYLLLGEENWERTCRTCAVSSNLTVPIFSGEGLQNDLIEKIHQHLPIKVITPYFVQKSNGST